MSLIKLVKKVGEKGIMLPTGKIQSVFPKESTEVTRKFLNTKAKI